MKKSSTHSSFLEHQYRNKTVLITGHTGFKGSWLSVWLKALGARVVGISLDPPTEPSHFKAAQLIDQTESYNFDIRNYKKTQEIILKAQPDFVFHLAAQALVRESYENPIETWEINLLGTLSVLEGLRKLEKSCAAVIITSDKCYDNVEWVWGYREHDPMGGPDPYSASKGAAELAIRSHIKSYFPMEKSFIRIASARAGNVIGGGDWALNRIIPDCVKAWSQDKHVELRNPHSTRPWQHVLEPLSGYLLLATKLTTDHELHGEAFNFGPQAKQNHSVLQLVTQMAKHWEQVRWQDLSDTTTGPYESALLKLNCDKALHYLGWYAAMEFEQTVQMTAQWYRNYYLKTENIFQTTKSQILNYTHMAKEKGLKWAL